MNNEEKSNSLKDLKKQYPNIDPRTYRDYIKLKDINTKPFLMFSELIDNAISSFENHYQGQEWDKKLKIQIKMNFIGDDEIKEINSFPIIKGSYIKFNDNAFGMDEDTMKHAVKLNSKPKSNSKMNVHGRGLKQAAFFFGIDLEINTKHNENSWTIKQKLSEQESIDSVYWIETKKSDKTDPGTEIIINNIHKERTISQTAWKNIEEVLSYRYEKYFKKNKIEIEYEFQEEKNKTIKVKFDTKSKEEDSKISVINAFDNIEINDKVKMQNFIKNIEESIEKKINNEQNHICKKTAHNAKEKIKEIFNNIEPNQQNFFQFDINAIINVNDENKYLIFDFWLLKKSNSKYSGIRFFEGERAITHAGSADKETQPHKNWKPTTKLWFETGSTEHRFAGSCDLGSIGLSVKTDKSTFNMSWKTEKEIDKIIYSVWAVFNCFIMHARKEDKESKSKMITNSVIAEAEHMHKTKFPNEKIDFVGEKIDEKTKTKGIKYLYKISETEEWEIIIVKDDTKEPIKIFEKNLKGDHELTIVTYSAHPFWKRMDAILKKSFFIESLIPISLLFAISHIEWIESNRKEEPLELFNESSKILQK